MLIQEMLAGIHRKWYQMRRKGNSILMNTIYVRFKRVDHTRGIFFKLPIRKVKSRIPLTLYTGYSLQNSIYSSIPNISIFTRQVHRWPLRPRNQLPLLQPKDPQRAPISAHGSLITHVSTGTTEWLCSSTGGGGDTVCTPQNPHPVSPFPQTTLTHTRFTTYHQKTLELIVCLHVCLVWGGASAF